MRLAWAQRLSALGFLLAFVVHAHWADAASLRAQQVALLLAMVVSGAVHAALSLYVVITDYEARPRFARLLGPALATCVGAAIAAAGPEVATTAAVAPTPGHLQGAPCAECHAGTEARHGVASVADHARAGIGCEGCHDVVDGRRPLLARAWSEEASPCVQCHEDAWGGFLPPLQPPALTSGAHAPAGSGDAVPVVGPAAASLCAAAASSDAQLERALQGGEALAFELRSSDRERFADGKTKMTLRAAFHADQLALEAAWDDASQDPGDRLDVMTLAEIAVPHFERLGCVDTCHLGDPTPHRTSPGAAASMFVVDVARAREHRLTETGIVELPPASARVDGSLIRDAGRWRARIRLPLPRSRDSAGNVTLGISVFDGLPKAHALRPAPLQVRLDCAPR